MEIDFKKKEVFNMKEKKSISTLLLVVGVLFVLVAGSIFVSTAWKYLSPEMKEFCLFLVSGGLFVGAYRLDKQKHLPKIATAFYYMGVAFLGYFTMAVFGGMVQYDQGLPSDLVVQNNSMRVLLSCGVMSVPVAWRLFTRKKCMDLTALILLVDTVLFATIYAFSLSFQMFTILLAACVLVFAGVHYWFVRNGGREAGLQLVITVGYGVHAAIYLFCLAIMPFADGEKTGLMSVFTLVLGVVTWLSYGERKYRFFRILNSISIFWFVFELSYELNEIFAWGVEAYTLHMFVFLVDVLIWLWLQRGEMKGMLLIYEGIIWLAQLSECYDYDYPGVSVFLPFGFLLAGALGFQYYKEQNILDRNLCIWSIVGNVLVYGTAIFGVDISATYGSSFYWMMDVFFYALVGMMIREFLPGKTGKSICSTLVLTMVLFNLGNLADLILFAENGLPARLEAELDGVLAGMGIVLLKHIWYDSTKSVRVIQLVLTCMTMAALLLHNLFWGELGCVLILGLVSGIMLIVASKKNHKGYAILAAVTLIIMVLYLTRQFWLSIAWWVYLFVAGVVLIRLAIKKEKEA